MKFKKLVITTLTVLSVAVTGASVATTNTTAYAKTKAAKVLKTSKFKTKHKVNVKGGWMYSSAKLTKKNHHMTHYLYTKFYASKNVTVRRASGKKATYTYIKSTNGKIKGYLYSGYVMNKWPKKYDLKAYKADMLQKVNSYREKKGLNALERSDSYDELTRWDVLVLSETKNKDDFQAGSSSRGYTWSGSTWYWDTQSKKQPVLDYKNSQDMAKQVFASLTTNIKKYGLNKTDKYIGIGAYQHGQNFYTELVFSPVE